MYGELQLYMFRQHFGFSRRLMNTAKMPQKIKYSKTLVREHNLFQKHACNPKHLYIKAFFTGYKREERSL